MTNNYYLRYNYGVLRTPTNSNLIVDSLFPLKRRFLLNFIFNSALALDFYYLRAGIATFIAHLVWNKAPLLEAPYWLRKIVLDERGGNFGGAR